MNKDLVELLLELKDDIGAISSDLNRLNDKLDVHSETSKKTAEKVAELEKDSWRLKGAIGAILSISAIKVAIDYFNKLQ